MTTGLRYYVTVGPVIRGPDPGVLVGTRCVLTSCDGEDQDVAYVHPSSDDDDEYTCRERDANAAFIVRANLMVVRHGGHGIMNTSLSVRFPVENIGSTRRKNDVSPEMS